MADKSRREEVVRALINPFALGNALGIISLFALIFYAIMDWFSDYNGYVIYEQYPLSFSILDWTIIIGLVEAYVVAYVTGWVIAKIYNRYA